MELGSFWFRVAMFIHPTVLVSLLFFFQPCHTQAPEPFPELYNFNATGNPPQPLSPDPLVRYVGFQLLIIVVILLLFFRGRNLLTLSPNENKNKNRRPIVATHGLRQRISHNYRFIGLRTDPRRTM